MVILKVVWTHELSFPKLLSNDGDLFVKSTRFRLESIEPFVQTNVVNGFKEIENEHSEMKSIKKHFFLVICPTRVNDIGWYSCSLIKKNINDLNIKYYTYLNVQSPLNANNNSQKYDKDTDTDYSEEFEEYEDFDELCREKELINQGAEKKDILERDSTLSFNSVKSFQENEDLKSIQ